MTITATDVDLNRVVRENVALTLFRLGMSQRDLAERSGINRNTLHTRMSGRTEWSLSDLSRAAGALGLTLDEILGELPDFEEWAERVRHQGLEPRTRCFDGFHDQTDTPGPFSLAA